MQVKAYLPVTDVQFRRNLPKARSLGAQPPHVIVTDDPARTPKLLTGGLRVSDTSTHTFANQVAGCPRFDFLPGSWGFRRAAQKKPEHLCPGL